VPEDKAQINDHQIWARTGWMEKYYSRRVVISTPSPGMVPRKQNCDNSSDPAKFCVVFRTPTTLSSDSAVARATWYRRLAKKKNITKSFEQWRKFPSVGGGPLVRSTYCERIGAAVRTCGRRPHLMWRTDEVLFYSPAGSASGSFSSNGYLKQVEYPGAVKDSFTLPVKPCNIPIGMAANCIGQNDRQQRIVDSAPYHY